METWSAINSVRVVRDFAERPLSPEHEARILNAARRTGSSKNEQTWAFIVIRDRDHLRELTGVGRYADHLAGAAMAVALVTPDESAGWRNTRMWDLGRAAQNMVLAAWELGIGSAPATVFEQELAGRLLGLPADRRCSPHRGNAVAENRSRRWSVRSAGREAGAADLTSAGARPIGAVTRAGIGAASGCRLEPTRFR